MLPSFAEIMQNFILMQNTQKKDWIGGKEIFKKSALFGQYRMLA